MRVSSSEGPPRLVTRMVAATVSAHCSRIAHGRKLNQPCTVLVLRQQIGRKLNCQASLANSAYAGDRHHL